MAKDARDPRKVAAIKKAKKSKQSDTSKKLASMTMKEMFSYIDDDVKKYIKDTTGWSDREMYLRFTDDPVAYGELKGEYDMLTYGGRDI